MKPADVTVNWIFGNGAVPFVKQFKDYGITGAVAVPMSNNFSDAQLGRAWDDPGLGMIACDYYAWTLNNPANNAFIEAYEQAVQRGETDPAGLRRVAGRDDVPGGPQGRWWRHRPEEGHPGNGETEHGRTGRQVHGRAVQERVHRPA